MSVYARIFAATSKRFTSAASSGKGVPPQAFWAVPGFVGFTWFIWGALTDEIKQSVGMYYDPDALNNKIEAEKAKRLSAREALKAAKRPAKDDDDEEEDEEEEEEEPVTVESIEAAVNAAVEQVDEDEEEEEEEDEEEEAPKPKKKKVDVNSLTQEELWDYVAEKFTTPGEVSLCVLLSNGFAR